MAAALALLVTRTTAMAGTEIHVNIHAAAIKTATPVFAAAVQMKVPILIAVEAQADLGMVCSVRATAQEDIRGMARNV